MFLKEFPPTKANKFFPQWYKDMNKVSKLEEFKHTYDNIQYENINAKSCPGLREIVNDGFIIPLWSDLMFATEYDNDGKITNQHFDFTARKTWLEDLDMHLGTHQANQSKNMNLKKLVDGRILKLNLPYYIEVPEGYSIYYSDPFYHFRDEIKCLPAIVEADKWGFIAFPFEVLKDEFVLEAGTPLIHCHVFKRETENLKLDTKYLSDEEYSEYQNKYHLHFAHERNLKHYKPTKPS